MFHQYFVKNNVNFSIFHPKKILFIIHSFNYKLNPRKNKTIFN